MSKRLKDIKNQRRNGLKDISKHHLKDCRNKKERKIVNREMIKIIQELFNNLKLLLNKHYRDIENYNNNMQNIDKMHRKNQIKYVHKSKD